jgi:hypothetical protein
MNQTFKNNTSGGRPEPVVEAGAAGPHRRLPLNCRQLYDALLRGLKQHKKALLSAILNEPLRLRGGSDVPSDSSDIDWLPDGDQKRREGRATRSSKKRKGGKRFEVDRIVSLVLEDVFREVGLSSGDSTNLGMGERIYSVQDIERTCIAGDIVGQASGNAGASVGGGPGSGVVSGNAVDHDRLLAGVGTPDIVPEASAGANIGNIGGEGVGSRLGADRIAGEPAVELDLFQDAVGKARGCTAKLNRIIESDSNSKRLTIQLRGELRKVHADFEDLITGMVLQNARLVGQNKAQTSEIAFLRECVERPPEKRYRINLRYLPTRWNWWAHLPLQRPPRRSRMRKRCALKGNRSR